VSTALYRRYRPESFAEVIGQEHVTTPLMAALGKDRVNHAYLFSGPRGCGKTTSARILARSLNCAKGPVSIPCGECDSCRDLARGGGGSLDVVEIDAASHGGVDDARSLRERAVFAPARDRFKVFIIDEAHMVSTQGFNALLKIVEEPPPHVRFVFATTEPEKVIGTIRSRTHHYPFRLVPPERLQSYLAELAEREGVVAGPGVLPLVVRAGGGSVRDSLSVLDQLIAGAGPEGLTYPTAIALLGYTDSALLDDVVDALSAGDGATVFGVVDRVVETGQEPRRFVEDLLERLRDLLVVAAVPDGGHAVLRSLPADQLERMRGQAARFGRAELSRSADVVNTALTEMTGATSPRLQLELLCARLLLPGSEDSERGLRARLDLLEKRMSVTPAAALRTPPPAPPRAAPAAAAPTPAPPPAPAPAAPAPADPAPAVAPPPRAAAPAAPTAVEPAVEPAAAPTPPVPDGAPAAPGGVDTATVRRVWPDVMSALAASKRTTWSLVSQYSQVLDYDGQRLLIEFDSAGRAASFGRGAHQEYLRQAMIEVIGLDCRFEALPGSAAPPTGARPDRSGGQSAGSRPAPGPTSARPPASAAAGSRPAPAGAPADTAVPEEPDGWGPRSATARPADPAPGGRGPSGTGPARSPARPGRLRPAGRRPGSPGRDDDVPLPPEPVDFEPPPEDAGPPLPRLRPQDDVPSKDDEDIEGSNLVGAPVVVQLLGGRVIEERTE